MTISANNAEQNGISLDPLHADNIGESDKRKSVKGHGRWRSRLRHDKDYRRRVIRSVWLGLAFFAVGLGASVRGPAFMDIQLITGTTVRQASAFFAAGSAGYMVGSLSSGFVYDLWSQSMLLIVCLVGSALLTAATPFCRQFWLMMVIQFLAAIFGGGVDTVGNADLLRTWGGKGAGEAALQSIHFTFALGAVVAPIFTEPFLASTTPHVDDSIDNLSASALPLREKQPLPETLVPVEVLNSTRRVASASPDNTAQTTNRRRNSSSHASSDELSWEAMGNVTDLVVVLVDGTDHASRDRHGVGSGDSLRLNVTTETVNTDQADSTGRPSIETRVHFAYIIVAVVSLLSALPLMVEYLMKSSCQKKRKSSKTEKKTRGERKKAKNGDDSEQNTGTTSQTNLPRGVYLGMLVWACAVFLLYVAVEETFSSFLAYYVVHQVSWTKSQGAMLTSVFWISFAASRFTCIFLTKVMSAVKLLFACFCLMLLSFAGFLVVSLWRLEWGVWLSSAVGGAAMSSIFPSGLSWIDAELLPVTGRAMSAVTLASSFGVIISPLVLGHQMETQGAIWFAYILLGETIMSALTFTLLLLFTRLFLHRRYGPPRREADVMVTEPELDNGALPEHARGFLDTVQEEEEVVV